MGVRALEYVRGLLAGRRNCGGCGVCPLAAVKQQRKLLLFGAPNVGKSVIFNQLTGAYAIVSNYPGTTVEVSRGRAVIGDAAFEVADTPGTYSLSPLSEDEAVARDMLLDEVPDLVLHVVGARDLRRMLPMTLQLIEAGLPVVLDINIIDEAERAGLAVDATALGRELGLPVVATAAAAGVGLDQLRAVLTSPPEMRPVTIHYPEPIEGAVAQIVRLLRGEYGVSHRAVALLLLQEDAGVRARLGRLDPQAAEEVEAIVAEAERRCPQPLGFPIAVARQEAADAIEARVVRRVARPLRPSFTETLGRLAMHPLAGLPILAAVVYFGLYLVVGKLGAGVAVDFLEKLFERHLDPAVTGAVNRLLPWPVLDKLFVGDYGVITLGLRYAFAIVLPLVTAFFLMFALLEDSGYLPRLAMMVDRLFKRIGLSGRAVIPLVLGLGCDTMATLVTRVLETRRERVIATFLLALAIPCSAQLGVILGLLAGHPAALGVWAGVVAAVFVLSGFLAARVLPGAASRFYIEIPPLRWPSLRNVLTKTWNRVRWYAAEVIPLFLLASVLLWIGEITRLFNLVIAGLRPVVHLLGLPDASADAFLFGFFRRDYGAARLFDVHSGGAISGVPLLVAMVTITLFVPCIAQFMVMQKERGLRAALAVIAIILPFAFGVGWLLNVILVALKVQL
jgi:ferrous iron transport protein B